MQACTRKKSQSVAAVGKLRLTSCLDPQFIHLEYGATPSAWETRGWVFQEKRLSRRCVISSSYQMLSECLHASWCEETNHESTEYGGNNTMPKRIQSVFSWRSCRQRHTFSNYCQTFYDYSSGLVWLYTHRQPTHDSNAFNAFQDIINTLSHLTSIKFP